jgi:signal peptidase II
MLRLGLILAAVVFALDQASKYFVLNVLAFSPDGCLSDRIGCRRIELSPIVDLSMVWNHGVSFGLLRAESTLERVGLVIMTLLIVIVFGSWLRSTPRLLTGVALGCVIGGALGNLVDRVRFGAVADFIDVSGFLPFFPWVFNVADAAISVGAGILVLDMLLQWRAERAQAGRLGGA